MAIDWGVLGTAITAIVVGVGTWFQTKRSTKAKYEASSAEYGAEKSISNAESSLYEQLRQRIDDTEKDIKTLRNELEIERRHGRSMELHIWKLERLMRDANMVVPAFVEILPPI